MFTIASKYGHVQRTRRCVYCGTHGTRVDIQDDAYYLYQCHNGHHFYINKPRFRSKIVRLYVWHGDVLAQDELSGGKWKRTHVYEQGLAPSIMEVMRLFTEADYHVVLNYDKPSQYFYLRRERDEERRLEAGRVHWEEQKLNQSSLLVAM